MSYKIGICDDEEIFQKELTKMVRDIAQKNGIQVEIQTFSNLRRLENFIDDPLEDPLDLILMDIYLEDEETGMDFAKKFKDSNNQSELIFITNSKDFALEGYTVDSKGYIVKPVDEKLLEEALMRTINKHLSKKIILQTPSKTLTVNPNQVLYIEIVNKELSIHFADSSVENLRMPLNKVRDKLPKNQFFQTHRSYMVSIPAIAAIKKKEVILSNGEHIPVSRLQYKDLQERLMQWNLESA